MKKTTKSILALLIFTTAFFNSCSNDDDSGESFGTTTGNFLPLAVDNRWNYLNEDLVNQNQVQIIGTSTVDGKKYFEYFNTGTSINVRQFFAKKGATYFLKTGTATTYQGATTIKISGYELPILKDDYAINENWTSSVSPKVTFTGNGQSGNIPLKLDFTGTNYYKGEVILNGITYPNVIKTRLTIITTVNGQVSTVISESWFAENIGIIKEIETSNGQTNISNIDTYYIY